MSSYIRFVVAARDPDSGRRQGLFQALGELADRGDLGPSTRDQYETVRQWFRDNLAAPDRLAFSSHGKDQAISWFKSDAVEHVSRMHEFCLLLEEEGVPVEVLRTSRPGYILYEDEHQVAAYPFADTPT